MQDTEHPVWLFELNLYGPFVIPTRCTLEEVDAFFSDDACFQSIEIKNASYGAQASFRVQASNSLHANQLALFAMEQLLNVLVIKFNTPLYVTRQDNRPMLQSRTASKRIMEKPEWQQALREAHYFLHHQPAYLQSLGHYRKALCHDNPVEKFLAFVNTMEHLAQHTPRSGLSEPKRDRLEVLQRAFNSLWSERAGWPHLQHDDGTLESIVDLSIHCTNGVSPILAGTIGQVVELLEITHRMAHAYLVAWRQQHIAIPTDTLPSGLHIETGWGNILQ